VGRLVIVSNRVPPPDTTASAGGLAIGLKLALAREGGMWFGWNGKAAPEASNKPTVVTSDGISYATLDLSRREYEEYYCGYANRTLWPVFHYRVDLAAFDDGFRRIYHQVNDRFARHLGALIEPDDIVWVHDYHLIPLGERLRAHGHQGRIGFFLHIPFPVREILSALPGHDGLVRKLFAYDLIGFQTESHHRAFCDYVIRELGGSVSSAGTARVGTHQVRTGVFPIGIDPDHFARLAVSSGGRKLARRMKDSLHGRDLVVGVDRLDYSKGLPQRLQAFELLLERHAALRGRVSMLQIASPSRSDVPEYTEIRQELERACGHINGRYADFDWVPVRYVNKAYGREALAGLLRVARIGLVTPLYDGMNLVAKEYVAAQDPDDPGVLVLSKFAGAAHQLDGALIVNPHDIGEVADAIRRGFEMDTGERRARWARMMVSLRRDTIHRWRDDFLGALTGEAVALPLTARRPARLRAV